MLTDEEYERRIAYDKQHIENLKNTLREMTEEALNPESKNRFGWSDPRIRHVEHALQNKCDELKETIEEREKIMKERNYKPITKEEVKAVLNEKRLRRIDEIREEIDRLHARIVDLENPDSDSDEEA